MEQSLTANYIQASDDSGGGGFQASPQMHLQAPQQTVLVAAPGIVYSPARPVTPNAGTMHLVQPSTGSSSMIENPALSAISKIADVEPFAEAQDGSVILNTEWLSAAEEPNPVQVSCDRQRPELKNVSWEALGTNGDLTGCIGRLVSNDAEGQGLFTSAAQSVSLGVERLLHPSEEVVATIKCLGFDGFPDWGDAKQEQRIGECLLVLVGPAGDAASKEPLPALPIKGQISMKDGPARRLLFLHEGALLRSASGSEDTLQIGCCNRKRQSSATWTIERERTSSFAVIHLQKQLVSITSDEVEKTVLAKSMTLQDVPRLSCAPWVGTLCAAFSCFLVAGTILESTADDNVYDSNGYGYENSYNDYHSSSSSMFSSHSAYYLFCAGFALAGCLLAFAGLRASMQGENLCSCNQMVKFSASATEKDRKSLSNLVSTTQRHKQHQLASGALKTYEGTSLRASYRALNMCVVDQCNLQTKELIAVVDPSVSTDEVLRFLLHADRCRPPVERSLGFNPNERQVRTQALIVSASTESTAATDEIILSEVDKKIFEKHDDSSFALGMAAIFGPGAHMLLVKAKQQLCKTKSDASRTGISWWVGFWKPIYFVAAIVWWACLGYLYDEAT